MHARDPGPGYGLANPQTPRDFDPVPLQALEAELAQRVAARGRPFSTTSWELSPAVSSASSRQASWMLWGVATAGVIAAVAGAFVLPGLAAREQRLALPATTSQPLTAPRTGPPRPAEPPESPTLLAQAAPATSAPPQASAPAKALAVAARPPARPPTPAGATAPAALETAADTSAAVSEPVQPSLAPPTDDDQPGPNFDCASPRGLAEEMVCQDTRLVAADRALGHALRRAQAAGVPDAVLRRQHARWVMARERAAQTAPWALPAVYDARIDELRREAETAEAGAP